MKNSVFALLLGLAAVLPSQGEVLYWMVNADTESEFPYAYASIKNADTGRYLRLMAEGEDGNYYETDITQIPSDAFAGEGLYAGLSSDDMTSTASFLVELYNASNEPVALTTQDSRITYAQLQEMGAIGASGMVDPRGMKAWEGGTFQAAPEPTSGLLMLFGLAGLALKRKRA